MTEFIEKYHLLKETQSGFRKVHSIFTVGIKLKDGILKAMNKDEITLAVMVDYSKAFDTVDYEILITKIHRLIF